MVTVVSLLPGDVSFHQYPSLSLRETNSGIVLLTAWRQLCFDTALCKFFALLHPILPSLPEPFSLA